MGLLDYDKLMTDPLFQVGIGILANNNSRNAGHVIGNGLAQGMGNIATFQQHQMLNDIRKQQFDLQKEEIDRKKQQEQKRTELFSRLPQTLGVNPDVLAAYPEIGQKLVERQFTPQEIKAYKPGDVLYQGDKQVGAIPSTEDLNPNKPFLVQDGQIVPNKAYQDYEISKARAGAANNTVSVNTGQKGFDNTLKLRGDFRSEPIYKAHQEVQSAYSQISSSLKQASPAGDLAGATKLMKILDPGSVVRESELGMAMAASGALDRLQNYATNVIDGTKLTPTQRADFQALADALYQESANQYNAKRGEYEGISTRNGLNTEDVVGPAAKDTQKPKNSTVAKSKQFDIGGKKVIGTLGSDGNYYVTQGGKKFRVEE